MEKILKMKTGTLKKRYIMTSIPLTILKSGQYIFKVDVEIKSEFFTLLYSLKSTEYFFMNKYCYYETV
jgi:hypothetical protein